VDVRSAPNATIQQVRWQWNSDLPGRVAEQDELREELTWTDRPANGGWNGLVPIPQAGRPVLGARDGLSLAASPDELSVRSKSVDIPASPRGDYR
jgi:hypothetical protein